MPDPDFESTAMSAMRSLQAKPLLDASKQEFPILNKIPFSMIMNQKPNLGYLEFWPPDEPGTPEVPRPQAFAPGTMGLEIYNPSTRPIDVMGDIASHHLVKTNPKMRDYYQQFQSSLTPEQQMRLQTQYAHSQKNEGEQRSFEQWKEQTGLPGYFRGYPFKQWDNPEQLYTPEQMKMFDEMMQYLRAPQP